MEPKVVEKKIKAKAVDREVVAREADVAVKKKAKPTKKAMKNASLSPR